jgi:sugar lactone lactonase YvrE
MQDILKVLFLAAFFVGNAGVTGYTLDQKGLVLMVDESYKASVFGASSDGFSSPDGILWSNGRLFLADEGGSSLRVLNGQNQIRTLCDSGAGVLSPEDLVIDQEGTIYFTDDDTGGVWQSDKDGKTRQLAGKEQGLISTEGIAIAPDGSLLVGDGETHQVFRVEKNGNVSVFLGKEYGIKKPESMVVDENGNLFIADNDENVLYLLTPDKKLHRPIQDREGFSPETIWYDKGRLFITDSQNGKLSVYSANEGLRTLAVFGGDLGSVNGITTDDQNNIYLSVQTNLKNKKGLILKIEKDLQP